MLFNSLDFLLFFLGVYLLYVGLRSDYRKQNWLLLLASYVFYGFWDYRFLALIFFSTVIDFGVGRKISVSNDPKKRKKLLYLSIVTNGATLGFFKYYNFFAENLASLLQLQAESLALNIILPVGISFYTFQSLSYTVDVYRGRLKACERFSDFCLYVSFFPQLVAGPIERAERLLTQIQRPRTVRAQDIEVGLHLIIWGLFMKVVVADNLGVVADRVFALDSTFQGIDVFIGLLAFSFQIYGDFSGYSNIARGVSRLMGFRLIQNFNLPYFALTPSDFWRRWHISLSQWLRDYIYIPLGGNRGSESATYRNLMLTMLFGGLWHGAAWNFVLWGAFHGAILATYRFLRIEESSFHLTRFFQWIVMSVLTLFGWLLFRVESMAHMGSLWSRMGWGVSTNTNMMVGELVFCGLPVILFELWQQRRKELFVIPNAHLGLAVCWQALVVASILIYGVRDGGQFLYFQF